MTRKSELRGKLEAIKELKQSHYTSSLNAYKYLQSIHFLEDIAKQVKDKNPNLKNHSILQPIDLSWLLTAIDRSVVATLDRIATELSTPTNMSLCSWHFIDHPVRFDPNDSYLMKGVHYWNIPYPPLVQTILEEEENADKQSLATTVPKLIPLLFNINLFPLKYKETGKILYFDDLQNDNAFLSSDLNSFVCACNAELVDHSISDTAEYETLKRALEQKDWITCHHILQTRAMTKWPDYVNAVINSLTHLQPPTEKWLLSDQLYDRACNEYTLKHTHIERQILIAELHKYSLLEEVNIETVIDAMDDISRKKIIDAKSWLTSMPAMSADNPLIQAIEHSIAQHQYVLTALNQNRPWLKEFLEH